MRGPSRFSLMRHAVVTADIPPDLPLVVLRELMG
jgi:hypothetical protein